MGSNKDFDQWDKICFEKVLAEPLRNGLTKPKKVRGRGTKMVNMKEIFSCDRIKNPVMDRVPLNSKEKEKTLLKKGDLLFARQSLVLEGAGKCSIIMDANEDKTFESHLIRARVNKNIANPLFYYYYFSSSVGKEQIRGIVEQVAAAGIRGSDLKKLHVPIPRKTKQDKLVSILSAFDDKIELNNQISKNLEEMAQAIFKRWFVDFEFPNEDGEPYKSISGEFVESELGLIPKGWEVKSFNEISEVLSGGTPKTKEPSFWGGNIPFFSPKDAQGGFYVLETERFITEEGLNNCNSKLYPKNSVFITARGTVGKVRLSAADMAMNQSCYALKGKPGISQLFLFLLINTKVNQLKKGANGAVFDTITVSTFNYLKVVVPPAHLIKSFTSIIDPFFEKLVSSQMEIRYLQETRDTLLPKLMSGEIRVPMDEEAEKESQQDELTVIR